MSYWRLYKLITNYDGFHLFATLCKYNLNHDRIWNKIHIYIYIYIYIYISFGPVITIRPKTFSHQNKQKVLFYKIWLQNIYLKQT